MLVNHYTNEELWNLEKPVIPQRSRLFPLEPIGIGTIYVESLSGYVARLAEHHSTTTEQLILSQILPLMGQKMSQTSPIDIINNFFGIHHSLASANEIRGIFATTLIQVLEELTLRRDLANLSPLKWASLTFECSFLRLYQAWCPLCYASWRTQNRIIYNPLLWLVNTIKFCPHHEHQTLIEQCPHCDKQFPPLTRCSRPGYCSSCHLWLGGFRINQNLDEQVVAENSENSWQHLLIGDFSSHRRDRLTWQFMWFDDVEDLVAKEPSQFLPPTNFG
ncbi:TniQ family protein [Nostoc sp. FACHB-892]|uniref:TniQ family protein n=1 Tax=Nostoc sp. FACHB-892 TaxID=2692843 RepID=UPI00168287E7|nr:TniQ family protein [Nostoc sp. FACHB-892]MBD2731462.1 TniQ family protein [Nostoc sp. FACHB-892]